MYAKGVSEALRLRREFPRHWTEWEPPGSGLGVSAPRHWAEGVPLGTGFATAVCPDAARRKGVRPGTSLAKSGTIFPCKGSQLNWGPLPIMIDYRKKYISSEKFMLCPPPMRQGVSGEFCRRDPIWTDRARVATGRDGAGAWGWEWAEGAVRKGREARVAGTRSGWSAAFSPSAGLH